MTLAPVATGVGGEPGQGWGAPQHLPLHPDRWVNRECRGASEAGREAAVLVADICTLFSFHASPSFYKAPII